MKKIEFYHVNWCPPCRNALKNVIEPLKEIYGNRIKIINCQDDPFKADKAKIDKLPVTILIDVTEVKRIIGIPSKEELERFLNDSDQANT